MRAKHIVSANAETQTTPKGETTVFLATAEDTNGRVSVFDSQLPKGNSAPWHYHETDDEIFYVVSGEVEFGINDDEVIARAGDLVIAGPKVLRRFKALTDSHLVVINAPGGPSERFLRDISGLQGVVTEEDNQRFIVEYGIHIVDKE
ncbi:cupin domain-containing protein [Aliamphritea ceti]|uniref:cupin domain-containing protein n=1 Tax=Aliamphritea ceti TaxID=1524258 RepID=UPI0021C380E9|nr:cupin domain-containing protein [Aliamphritea ceti]